MKHPQHDNLIIAANDKDALFETGTGGTSRSIEWIINHPNHNWTHVKQPYAYQHVKDAREADKSLVVQVLSPHKAYWGDTANPEWAEGREYRIKPKPITKRLYADMTTSEVRFLVEPAGYFNIPINGTDTEVECE